MCDVLLHAHKGFFPHPHPQSTKLQHKLILTTDHNRTPHLPHIVYRQIKARRTYDFIRETHQAQNIIAFTSTLAQHQAVVHSYPYSLTKLPNIQQHRREDLHRIFATDLLILTHIPPVCCWLLCIFIILITLFTIHHYHRQDKRQHLSSLLFLRLCIVCVVVLAIFSRKEQSAKIKYDI